MKIYSKISPGTLLHIIIRKQDFLDRNDIVPPEHFIQCAALKMPEGKTFRPHKHIMKERSYKNNIAQESWVVIQGLVRCIFYDLNDEILETHVLNPGDASFTLQAGHTYEILENDTLVYEYKTGPYEGLEFDKEFLDE